MRWTIIPHMVPTVDGRRVNTTGLKLRTEPTPLLYSPEFVSADGSFTGNGHQGTSAAIPEDQWVLDTTGLYLNLSAAQEDALHISEGHALGASLCDVEVTIDDDEDDSEHFDLIVDCGVVGSLYASPVGTWAWNGVTPSTASLLS